MPLAFAGLLLLAGARSPLKADENDLKSHGPIQWIDSVDQAKKLAAKSHKPIMIDFWAKWCGPCLQMLATTYKDKQVLEKSKLFVPVLINYDKAPEVVKKYKISSMPVLIFLDSKGKIIEQSGGFHKSDEVLKMMANALKKNK